MSTAQIQEKSFFATLFDFGFTSFITLRFLRVIYTVLVFLILLVGLVAFLVSISQGGIYILFAIVIVPIITLIYLVLTRISLEMVAMFFRIGENTTLMAAAAGDSGPTNKGRPSGLPGPYSGSTGPLSGPPPPQGPPSFS